MLGKHLGKNKSCKLIISLIRSTVLWSWLICRARCKSVESAVGCQSVASRAAALSIEAHSAPFPPTYPPTSFTPCQSVLSRFGNALKCATCFMTSLCDFLFISLLLSSLLRFVFIKFSTHTHIYTHITHTHTHEHRTQHTLMQSSLICSLACRGILFALSVSVALIKEICQIQTLVNVFHSPVKQFVCYLGSQLSLHLCLARFPFHCLRLFCNCLLDLNPIALLPRSATRVS